MIQLRHIYKSYGEREVLTDFNMDVDERKFVVITGKSGSGKTTLLNMIGGIDKPDKGEVEIEGIVAPKRKQWQSLRRYNLGYIFQNYALSEEESVYQNLKLSKAYNPSWSDEKVNEAMETVGLHPSMLQQKAYELSGGEQQRIAIARVLLKKTNIILADEPTGNLDEENAEKVISIFKKLQKDGKTIICVTHNLEFAEFADQMIQL